MASIRQRCGHRLSISAIALNSTRRRPINRSTPFANSLTRRSAADTSPGDNPLHLVCDHGPPMTIKAVVFDAYGTLYDIQSVAAVTEAAYPGYGEIITQVWRIKQLEYTWLRSLMGRYQDFSVITRDSLAYTLRILGLRYDEIAFERIMAKYLQLDLYPDA